MPLTYCSCAVAGRLVHMALDLSRPGKYVCIGCGAPEEVVFETQKAMNAEWVKSGAPMGIVPESLLDPGTIVTDELGGPKVTPYKEPWVEGQHDSGRSLGELVSKHKEIAEG